MLSATGVLRSEGFPYALDNGAWTAHRQQQPFDEVKFLRAVESHGPGADWIVVPDIVGGGLRSLEFSMSWVERLRGAAPLYFVVQDGMGADVVADVLQRFDGLFVGGSDEFKATVAMWAPLAHAQGKPCHLGRVNTAARLRLIYTHHVDSFDGSGVSRWAKHARYLTAVVAARNAQREFQWRGSGVG